MRERAFGSLKYEHRYRLEITDRVMLADQAEHYRHILNTIRPHEALQMRRPTDVYLTATPTLKTPKLSQIPDAGHVLPGPAGREVECLSSGGADKPAGICSSRWRRVLAAEGLAPLTQAHRSSAQVVCTRVVAISQTALVLKTRRSSG